MENKIWYYRTKQKLTLRDLSNLTGISVSNLDKIENDKTHDIMLRTAVTIAEALHVDLYELFCINRKS